MVITQFIMGFIMCVYLMVIGTGHLTTKNVMAASKGDGLTCPPKTDPHVKLERWIVDLPPFLDHFE